MQKVLTLFVDNKLIISNPWCFEAFCIMSDKKYEDVENEMNSYLNCAAYLFEGTCVTNEVLTSAPAHQLKIITDEIIHWFFEDLTYISKINNDYIDNQNKSESKDLRDIYISFFKLWKILPTELAKQPTRFVFKLLCEKDVCSDVNVNDLPPDIAQLYGN